MRALEAGRLPNGFSDWPDDSLGHFHGAPFEPAERVGMVSIHASFLRHREEVITEELSSASEPCSPVSLPAGQESGSSDSD